MRLSLFAISLAAFSIGSAPLLADTVTFFGQDLNTGGVGHTSTLTNSNAAHNAFAANLTGVETQTFESYATGAALPLVISFGAAGNATLTDPSGNTFIAHGADANGRFPISGTQYLVTAGAGFTITFSTPISAFGFYGTDVGDLGGILSLGLQGSSPETLTVPTTVGSQLPPSGSALYFGFYDTTKSFSSVTFHNTGGPTGDDTFGFDDFTIGTPQQVTPVSATPEPASLWLIGTGMTALVGLRRFRQS